MQEAVEEFIRIMTNRLKRREISLAGPAPAAVFAAPSYSLEAAERDG
jgi:hypothetical protein